MLTQFLSRALKLHSLRGSTLQPSFFHTKSITKSTNGKTNSIVIRNFATKLLPIVKALQDASLENSAVTIQGWVRSVRDQKTNTFLDINDGSCLNHLQVLLPSQDAQTMKLSTGASIKASGILTRTPKGGLELSNASIQVIGEADSTYPLQKKKHSLEYLRENAHLRSRGNLFGAVLRVRNSSTMAVHNYFQSEGYIQIHTPILNANDCEGAGELFVVNTREEMQNISKSKQSHLTTPQTSSSSISSNFFNVPECYLTVSGQLEAEIFATSMSKVYTFGPTFRAEDSHTPRHLAEFWMIEPEIAFASLNDVMDTAESFVKSCVNSVNQQSMDDLKFFQQFIDPDLLNRLNNDQKDSYARMTYTKAIDILEEKSNFNGIEWGMDLSREHEQWICQHYTHKPVFVTHYPKSLKPFYMRLTDKEESVGRETVECCDLLVPKIGELIGGSAREERFDRLTERMKQLNLNTEAISWYLDLRRFGSVPHGGFGLGFERFLLYVTGMENIRDVIPIPRHPGYCKF